jgi:hypothetical protein
VVLQSLKYKEIQEMTGNQATQLLLKVKATFLNSDFQTLTALRTIKLCAQCE